MKDNCFQGETLRMATTTSTQDSGLLNVLNPAFENKTGCAVTVFSKGTGGAIQMAVQREADLIFVHWREEEDKFVSDGYGVNRRNVMYNDFAIVGPKDDPAGIADMKDVTAAFLKIRAAGESGRSKFFSRADQSGTYHEEMKLWQIADIKPAMLGRGEWYSGTNKGMGETLVIAQEKKGYTLTDRGTWLKYEKSLGSLKIVVQGPLKGGDSRLMNPYGVIAVNPAYNQGVNYELAMMYIAFVTSPEGQELIRGYKLNGEPLFIPDAE